MLRIEIPGGGEFWDEKRERFITPKGQVLQLEHSLVSISKWESKWKKPFMGKSQKTEEESLDYIRCMTLTQNVDPDTYLGITPKLMEEVYAYINAPMTATTFQANQNRPPNREVITSEIIYYWMIVYGIPFECQKWHLNRLLTLINVCNVKSGPQKKMGRKELMAQNRALNAARRKKLNTRG